MNENCNLDYLEKSFMEKVKTVGLLNLINEILQVTVAHYRCEGFLLLEIITLKEDEVILI